METVAFFRWKPACWLRMTGEDAANFLQGQFTNDLRELKENRAVYGLWLNQKGRVLADSFVLRGAGASEFWIGSYFSAAAVIRERLESYVIADDVVIEDETALWHGTTLFGELAAQAVAAGGGFAFPGRRGNEPHIEWVQRQPAAISIGRELDTEAMESKRILARIPAVPQDIGHGELPNEGGLEEVAISYTKGCYLGQEVMARLKSMGQVRRRLAMVSGSGESPEVGTPLFQGANQVGELRSCVRSGVAVFQGLALLKLVVLDRAQPMSLAPGGEPRVFLSP